MLLAGCPAPDAEPSDTREPAPADTGSDADDTGNTLDSGDTDEPLPSALCGPVPTADDTSPCAAETGSSCYYVAPDGDELAAGTIDDPFMSFAPALAAAQPGDVIYARGGTYGQANTMTHGAWFVGSDYTGSCDGDDLTWVDERCNYRVLGFAAVGQFDHYPFGGASAVASGTSTQPIVLRNYPGETPTLDMNQVSLHPDLDAHLFANGAQRAAIAINASHWVVSGFEVVGGSINLGGASTGVTLANNHVHDLTMYGGDNAGLIRVNRGPDDVRIIANRLHDLYHPDSPGEWGEQAIDGQHYGGVTMLSGEVYGGGPTGSLEICGNEISHVPQVFFFKNPAEGPIDITSNRFRDSGSLGRNLASNVRVRGNLLTGVPAGFAHHGDTAWPSHASITSHDLVFSYNTFVGLEHVMVGWGEGMGLEAHNNLVMGLPSLATDAPWGASAWLSIADDASATRAQTVDSNDNCFVVADAAFNHTTWRPPAGPVSMGLDTARTTYGYDTRSTVIVETDPEAVFTDPASGDYSVRSELGCGAVGHLAWPPP